MRSDVKNKENLFSASYQNDSKHKLNTTQKHLPIELLDKIDEGVTLEQIEELQSDGYDVYKYQTQITLHGICKELTSERVGGYKCLTLNQNGSIGVRWIAVDYKKKDMICKKLSYFGWSSVRKSTEMFPYLCKRVSTPEEALNVAMEYKKIAERIDSNLFFGSYNIWMGSVYGCYYVVCFDLFINGIREEDINTLLEQITGRTIEEINSEIERQDEEKRKRYKEMNRKYEEERKIRQAKEDEQKKKLLAEILQDGYKRVNSKQLVEGAIFFVVKTDWSGNYRRDYYRMGKKMSFPIHNDGSEDLSRKRTNKYRQLPLTVFTK